MEKENVGKVKVLTLISNFGLGVLALIGAYLIAECIDSNLKVFESIKATRNINIY